MKENLLNSSVVSGKPHVSRKTTRQRAAEICSRLSTVISPHCELNFSTALDLLVAVVLSAQATDASVNQATETLFQKCRTPQDYLNLGEDNLIAYIRHIGLYKNKAKAVLNLCAKLIRDFNGIVPDTREQLMTLPGVGQKSANVVLNVWFHQATIPVDTHVFRVSHRLNLTRAETPEKTEEALLKCIPDSYLMEAHHLLLLHGRYTCTARNPKCSACILNDICPKSGKDFAHYK